MPISDASIKPVINTVGADLSNGGKTDHVWKDIKLLYTKSEDVPSFTNAQLVTYFVCRTVNDGLPAGDFKSINKSAKYLFDCGHTRTRELF